MALGQKQEADARKRTTDADIPYSNIFSGTEDIVGVVWLSFVVMVRDDVLLSTPFEAVGCIDYDGAEVLSCFLL